MSDFWKTENILISPESKIQVSKLLSEAPVVKDFFNNSEGVDEFKFQIKKWALNELSKNSYAEKYYKGEVSGHSIFKKLRWKDFAAIRILDYIEYSGLEYKDQNLRGQKAINDPFKTLYLAVLNGTGGGTLDFFMDMTFLFRQFLGKLNKPEPSKKDIEKWMDNHPSGLDKDIISRRKKNKDRIIKEFIKIIDDGKVKSATFHFDSNDTFNEKYYKVTKWWNSKLFHLKFAIRTPELLNKLLNYSLDQETMEILNAAKEAGIPFFVNPYYLSLLDTESFSDIGADLAIRDYVIYSKELIDEFGNIVAWEKEDEVEPGKPNAAGWILPSTHNVHRRYPEVAILIPDSMGRACGGLCVSCQRMYDFQRGNLNFNLDKLMPNERWPKKLARLMKYFQDDSQLRDILITGGDAFMSSDRSLRSLLDAVYDMAKKKIEDNKNRKEGDKFAEMLRIRLGTRLPVYLPQRITDEFVEILAEFKQKATKIGFKQFIIQTHFESAMEVTPEAKEGITKLIKAGWTVTNQQVFTSAASRRGHTAKLRKVLNEVGVLTYYTFTVKGYMENHHNFATNARAVQEQQEEKKIGQIPEEFYNEIRTFPEEAENMIQNIEDLKNKADIPFLATDRNVLNLPGVGKSLTFRTIGITNDGRRILNFDHDSTRIHSPIINKMGKVLIIESKSIGTYLRQIKRMGEDNDDYLTIWGYSIGETEKRMQIYEYPGFTFEPTSEMTNLKV